MENNKEHNREQLLKHLKPGATVYTLLRHTSKSGQNRVIELYAILDNTPYVISGYAADFLEGYDRKYRGCKAHGCGMDMGFHLVEKLSYKLFGNGSALKQRWL